ncbi:hypothetical protein HELRODRAFT_177200 [Helobdella robusta]|uniref:EF-hand domain-containing protein n=1 Tax=Helobdella robusta TaxID=6412 RepID=T1FBC3_HELRO|nr:hypothetical protein HELRODRAFT_177200 [Helobdella robusta]ESN98315.1 hypothetical protein HELRODRAFT_177200 [Helobdella robusta]
MTWHKFSSHVTNGIKPDKREWRASRKDDKRGGNYGSHYKQTDGRTSSRYLGMSCHCHDPAVVSQVFDELDADKSGKIDKKELFKVFKLLCEHAGQVVDDGVLQAEAQKAIEELDRSGDGMIDKAEFMEFMNRH